jgi:hypothetical protein
VKNIVIWWRKWWSEPRKTLKASKQERYGDILGGWLLLDVVVVLKSILLCTLTRNKKTGPCLEGPCLEVSDTYTLFLDRLTTPSLYNDHSNHLLFLVVDRYQSVWSTNTKEWLRGWRTKSLKSKV